MNLRGKHEHRDGLLADLRRRLVLYAWTEGYLRDLTLLAEAMPDIVAVEAFPPPRDRRGFAVPPIGRATLRRVE